MHALTPPARSETTQRAPSRTPFDVLALCPLLSVIETVGEALTLSLALVFVTWCASGGAALARLNLAPELERPALALLLGAATAIAARLGEAFAFDVYAAVALFLGVIASNGLALAAAERALREASPARAVRDALATSLRAAALLVAFGALREAFAHASLFAGVGALVGAAPDAVRIDLHVGPIGLRPIGIVAMPAGALLLLAALASLFARAKP